MVQDTKDRIEPIGYTQLVRGHTRFWRDTAPSTIDLVWTNSPQKLIHCKNLDRPVADHNLVEVVWRLKGCPKVKMESLSRKWKSLNVNEFRREIEEIKWEDIQEFDNVDIAYDFLESKLRNILDRLIPIKKTQPNKKIKAWITEKTKDTMKLRDIARRNATTTNGEQEWSDFRKLRNLTTELVRKDRKNYQKKYISEQSRRHQATL